MTQIKSALRVFIGRILHKYNCTYVLALWIIYYLALCAFATRIDVNCCTYCIYKQVVHDGGRVAWSEVVNF